MDRCSSLDWYYQLISFFPDIAGELKSAIIVAHFRSLPSETQIRIWRDLSLVKIHIVDPRPHFVRIRNMVLQSLNRPDALELVEVMEMQDQPCPKSLGDYLRETIAERILNESTAMRLQSLSQILNDPFAGAFDSKLSWPQKPEPKLVVTLDAFGNRRDIVRQATSWSAKSSAAFHSALDTCFSDDDATDRFFIGQPYLMRMAEKLRPTHAFDIGNRPHIELLESARDALIDEIANHSRICRLIQGKGFVEVDSKGSYYGQAADFAAGIASDLYATEGLTGVVLRFEHVSYNGGRVSLADAEEEMKLQNMIEVDY